ncbi:MEMO1 family protein [Sinisalibacter aestuarii]|uniref:MEMO1 family protein n=2 Tax=Sinisalibacter aestuarii TaxID=2949426 RepID=A0ABQ5LWU3_9RHOB|nr:MEMO1 family protein [Sinisalibacter aestuarii]
MFYPADAAELARAVEACLARGAGAEGPQPPRAIISPHAGYAYSGWLAGAAWQSTAGADIRHAVVLSPSHRHAFAGIALPSGGAYAMPGFDLAINTAARTALMEAGLAHIEDAAHDREHGAETQFPFLHALHPQADVLPLVLGQVEDAQVAAALDLLDGLLGHPLFVLSSDLSHFLTEGAAIAHDDAASRLIETGAWQSLSGAHACGARGIRGYLASRTGQGARAVRLARATSAEVTHDTSRVVGYGAWALYGPEGDAIRRDDRAALLRVAREALAGRTATGRDPKIDPASFHPRLRSHGAAFVTLTRAGRLRGCIGSLTAHRPLVQDVAQNAICAGHADPRFAAVTAGELAEIHLKIAVLGPPAPMAFASEEDLLAQLRPGEDGLILSDRGRRGTFLPMVWESLPEPAAFWRQLKRKAELAEDHWSDTLEVQRYRAESFAEG